MKSKNLIPSDVDPIELADKIKRGMTTRFLKRYMMHVKSGSRRKDFDKLTNLINELRNDPKTMDIAKKFIIMHSGKIH